MMKARSVDEQGARIASPGYIFAKDEHSHVLGHWTEETACGYCGGPIYVGERAFYRSLEGPWYCSHACVKRGVDR